MFGIRGMFFRLQSGLRLNRIQDAAGLVRQIQRHPLLILKGNARYR